MRGYSLLFAGLIFTVFTAPSHINNERRLHLQTGKIIADRSSPAFSAIEDAFVLKDLIDEKVRIIKEKEKKQVRLKGIKLSGNKKADRKVESIKLVGEKVEVAHFTNKFINKSKVRMEPIRLSSIEPSWSASSEASKITVEEVTEALSTDNEKASDKVVLNEVRLPSGIVLTKPEGLKISGNNQAQPQRGSVVRVVANEYNPNLISGKIEIDGGDISYEGEDFNYYIERSFDGKIYETGVVSGESGDFDMELGALKGFLAVELRSEKGEVLAYGEKEISKIANLKDFKVSIYPNESIFSGRILEDESSISGKETPALGSYQKVGGVEGSVEADEQGYINESIFEKGSSFVVKTKAKNRWPDLGIGVSGKPLYPRLIKKETLKVLSKSIDPFGEEIEITSALIGSVTQTGLSQRGVEVRIYENEFQKPVYFEANGALNPGLSKTSAGGSFVFANLSDGGYLVQAVRGQKVLAQKWFIVKRGHVSRGQIQLNKLPHLIASAEFFPTRVKTKEKLLFKEIGVEEKFNLSEGAEKQIKLKSNPELVGFSLDHSEDFSRHIYISSTKSLKKRLRVVSKTWLEAFLNERRSNANRTLGMVVGFIPRNDFKIVRETTTALSKSSQIFYFDKNGDFTESGLAGGGFVITDVPSGIRTTAISMRGKRTFLNKVTLVQPHSISTF